MSMTSRKNLSRAAAARQERTRERRKPRRILQCVVVAAALAINSAAANAAGPTLLRFGYPNPPNTVQYTDMIQGWTQKVNKEADGLFHIKVFVGNSLIDMHSAFDRVQNGIADIAFCVLGPVSSQFPRTQVATLPGVARNAHDAGLALQRLYEEGIIADEWKRVKPLAFIIYPDLTFHTAPMVKTLADMKGLKLSVQGRIAGETLEALGGVPISLPLDELYEALQRGTIQGTTLGWPGVTGYKLTDIVKNHLLEPYGAVEAAIIMNNATYARLPPQAKHAIDVNSGTFFTTWFNKFVDGTTQQAIDDIRHMKDQTITQLSPEQEAMWTARIQPVIAGWEKRTPDGARVLAAFRKEVAAIGSGS